MQKKGTKRPVYLLLCLGQVLELPVLAGGRSRHEHMVHNAARAISRSGNITFSTR